MKTVPYSSTNLGSMSNTTKGGQEGLGISGLDGPQEFSHQELKVATSNFSGESVLEEGGFGKVHRGVSPTSLCKQDEFAWTALMSRHTRSGQGRQALKIYEEMRLAGMRLSSYTFVAALKACSSLQDLESAKKIHAAVVKIGLESHVYVGTMLVDVYAKCGKLADARSLFDRMPNRTVVSWNAMILGYAQMEQGDEALQLFARMQEEGVVPDERTFVSALKACSTMASLLDGKKSQLEPMRNQCLEQVRAIHLHIAKSGSAPDVYVETMLVDAYAKCGSLVDARSVFEKMPCRDVVSWNAMILGYAQMEKAAEALQLYAQMRQEGVAPDKQIFVGALKACSVLAALEESSKGDGKRMKRQCLDQVKALHADVLKSGCESAVFVGTMLVDVYAKCGSLVDARSVFDKMPFRDVVSWTAMILAYAQMEEGKEALRLYSNMQREGVVPNERTFIAALKACSSLASREGGDEGDGMLIKKQCLEQVRSIHSCIMKSVSESDVFVGTMLVDVYAKCGSLLDARRVFDRMRQRDVVSWNAMISGYAQMEEREEALHLYSRMREEGIVPDARAFVAALKACNSLATSLHVEEGDQKHMQLQCLQKVRSIHSDIAENKSELDVFVGTMLVDVYAKCGSLLDARAIFEKMPHRDTVCWNAMISGYVQIGEGEEALLLYRRMPQEGVVPDDRTFVAAVKACGIVAGLEKGKEIHSQILKNGLYVTDSFLASSLVDMYGKCGSMVDAQQVFDALPTRDIVTWSALIAGYAYQGDSELVFDLFERMRQEGIQPDGIVFLNLLTVCSHAGLVHRGQQYFEAMSRDYGITATIDHHACMVDLLARAGHLDKAMAIAKTLQPSNGVVWKSILAACQKWRNLELGRQAFKYAISIDSNDAAAYILMSNIYAAAHMMEDAKEMQAQRMKTCPSKKPGRSWWADMSGISHAFVVGDTEHPESRCIYSKVRQLWVRIKEEACGPHPDAVFCEDELSGLSQKLGIAYALVKGIQHTTTPVLNSL